MMSRGSRQPKALSAGRTGATTIADVAALAGVSAMTVSRVLGASGYVHEDTKARVLDAIKRLNYTPNTSARKLAGSAQLRFGLLYNRPRSSYIMDFLLGAMDKTSLIDAQLVSCACDLDGDAPIVLAALLKSGIDAVMLTPPLCDSPVLIELATNANIPSILISTSKRYPGASTVSIDETAAALEMTRHLIGIGHRRIGFILGEPALAASTQRYAGFQQGLAEAGLELDPRLIAQGHFTYSSGLVAARRLLELDERPTAIFGSNDDMAAATIATAHQFGLNVPGDVSVCGFDDSWIATAVFPELTTIHQPVYDMAQQGVMMLLDGVRKARRSGGTIVASHRVETYQLVRRGSDARPAAVRPESGDKPRDAEAHRNGAKKDAAGQKGRRRQGGASKPLKTIHHDTGRDDAG